MVRVSGKAQIDRTGIPRQLADIHAICTEHNLTVAKEDEYRFPALSGADVEKSPEFRAMLARLDEPKIAGIVCSEVSRLFRPEFPDQMSISKPFRVNGKLIFYEQGVLDLRKERDQGIFVREAMEAGAHRKRIIKWTQWGRNERRRQADCKTDPLPAGVKFVPHPKTDPNDLVTGHFEYTHDFSSDRVIEAFNRIATGESQAVIARDLRFKSSTKLRQTLRSRWWIGEKHSPNQTVGAFMRDDGTKFHGKRRPRNSNDKNSQPVKANFNEPPLISIELWNAVQAILDDRHKTWVKVKTKGNPLIEGCLGHGIVYCECGRKVTPKKGKGAGGAPVMYYMCSSNANYNKPCGHKMLRQNKVDQCIRVWITLKLKNLEYLKTLVPQTPPVNTNHLEKRLAQLDRKADAYMSKVGDEDVDQDRNNKFLAATEKEIRELKAKLKAIPKPVVVDIAAVQKRLQHFAKLELTEQKERVKQVFKRITVAYLDDQPTELAETVGEDLDTMKKVLEMLEYDDLNLGVAITGCEFR
jgi:DNA-binding ferritin-like protein (Dps family)